VILRKGQRVFLSKIGNRNFYYPTERYELIIKDVECKSLAWAGGGNKKAFLVPADSINKCDLSGKIPVWICK
jgi:hypothetical protein